jgi:hypothetical protein
MPPTSRDPNNLLTELEAAKNRFDPGYASVIAKLLAQLVKFQFTDPHQLIRFHECLLFLRAFPHAQSQVSTVERLLDTFHRRIENLRDLSANLSAFDDFDTSGIAGTTMQDVLSFDVVSWLVRCISSHVEIAWNDYWDDYQAERSRGNTWPRFIPLLEEDAAVEANIPWFSWMDAARGRHNALQFLLNDFDQLPLASDQRAELYDSLRLPIRWKLENLKLSRTRNWTRPRSFYFHDAPLIQRSEVSLARELSRPAPKLEKLSVSAGESVMRSIRETMVVRYRELYGTTLGDPRSVIRADLGRGVVMYFWGLPPDRRLPLRAYVAGYTHKNGVPINYIEAIGLCEWIEIGFNTFYTYRQGETAWIYAQALRCLRALTGAKCFSIYPYQIGQNNDEAIDSGAFWFYRKLGFRPGRPDLLNLCEKEEEKIATNPKYKTPRRILKRLAEAHMFYELQPSTVTTTNGTTINGRVTNGTITNGGIMNAGATVEERPFQGRVSRTKNEQGFSPRGPWDTFSTRTLGLRINRRMAQKFNGDSQKIRRASTAAITRALGITSDRWPPDEQQSLENWALVLALIPDLARWSPKEKQNAIKIIHAKSARTEMSYLRQTQNHPRLRAELIRLGSK